MSPEQLTLGLDVETCDCCDDTRFVDAPHECMDDAPCPRRVGQLGLSRNIPD